MRRSLRRPALILVDELAHTNAPGSRHPKRWQDIDELLDAGIGVYTTLNVQHLESLNDVVRGSPASSCARPCPTSIFEQADEVELVDLPADDLLERLPKARCTCPSRPSTPPANFFRKGNLMALRELALRRTAERVEDEVRAYRSGEVDRAHMEDRGIAAVLHWARPRRRGLVRSAARLTASSGSNGLPCTSRRRRCSGLPQGERERILKTVKLAAGVWRADRDPCWQ